MIVAPDAMSLFLCFVPVAYAPEAATDDGIAFVPVFQDIVRTLIVVGFDVLKRVMVVYFQQFAFPIGEIASVAIPHDFGPLGFDDAELDDELLDDDDDSLDGSE